MSNWKQVGTNEDGIPVIEGGHKRPPLDSSLTLLITSLPLALLTLLLFLYACVNHEHEISRYWFLYGTVFLASASIGIGCIRTLRLRRKLRRAFSVEDISAKLQADFNSVIGYIEEQDIRPRYIVNGRAFYDLADLGDADRLLRPAAADPKSLLRASIPVPVNSETLLRAATSED